MGIVTFPTVWGGVQISLSSPLALSACHSAFFILSSVTAPTVPHIIP